MAIDKKQVIVDWLHLPEHVSLGVDCKKVGVSRTTLRNILEEADLEYPKMANKRRKPKAFVMQTCHRCGKPSQEFLAYKVSDRKENLIEVKAGVWLCPACVKAFKEFLKGDRDRS